MQHLFLNDALKLPSSITLSIAFVCAVLPNTSQAAFEDYLSKRWYVTEIAVFARSSIREDNTLEALTSTQPARLSSNLGSYRNPVDTTKLLAQTQRMLSRTHLIERQEPGRAFEMPAQPEPLLDPATGEPLPRDPLETFLEAVSAYEQHLARQHLYFVAEQNPRLDADLTRLLRRREHKVLWRGSWLQAVPPRKDAQPMFFQGGHEFADRNELEGSIALSVGRYLHLGLDLWYHDPEFSPPRAHTIDNTDAVEEPVATNQQHLNGTASEGSPIPVSESDAAGVNPNAAIAADLPPLPRPSANSPWLEPNVPRYMHLSARRRMRSGDLHYIDHPKFGILVRIDRIEPPTELLALYEGLQDSQ